MFNFLRLAGVEGPNDTDIHLWSPEYLTGDHTFHAILRNTDDDNTGSLLTFNNVVQSNLFIANTHCLRQVMTGPIRKAAYMTLDNLDTRIGASPATITTGGYLEHTYLNYYSGTGYVDWDVTSDMAGMTKLQLHMYSVSGQGDVEIYNWDGASETLLGTVSSSAQTATLPATVFEITLSAAPTVGDKLRVRRSGNSVRVEAVTLLHATDTPEVSDPRGILINTGYDLKLGPEGNGLLGNLYFDETDSGTGGGSTIVSAMKIAPTGDTPVFIGGLAHQSFSGTNGGWINATSDLVVANGYTISTTSITWQAVHDLSDDSINVLGEETIDYTLANTGLEWDVSLDIYTAVDTGTSYVSMFPANDTYQKFNTDYGQNDMTSLSGSQTITQPTYAQESGVRLDYKTLPTLTTTFIIANTNDMNKHYPQVTLSATTSGTENLLFVGKLSTGVSDVS